MRCMNCSYNNMAKGIGLLDKRPICVYTGKFHTSKAFESSIFLMTNGSLMKVKNIAECSFPLEHSAILLTSIKR